MASAGEQHRVLILGGAGMLGHKLWQVLSRDFDVTVTMRQPFSVYRRYGIFDEAKTICGIDVRDSDALLQAVERIRPQTIINAIGIIKQIKEAEDPIQSLTINSLLPHRLAALARATGARLIHISTDCVFSGEKGNYTEDDPSDARDLYGRTKFLGETSGKGALTLRTSIIGHELNTHYGLIEWFLGQEGKTILGFKKAIYTGFPTIVLARIFAKIIRDFPEMHGLYQVSSEPITKYDLLQKVKKAYGCNIKIDEENTFFCDRSLNSTRFRQAAKIAIPDWDEMVAEMKKDSDVQRSEDRSTLGKRRSNS